ncbi:putative stabilization of membrane [Branchiostoma belcheri]|nr:putative stabilization of membrane [Branchiostoma belcheri]
MDGRHIGRNNVAKLDTPVPSARPGVRSRTDGDGNISDDGSLSRDDQRAFAVRQCLKPVLSHVGIVALLLSYCFVGAAIFQAIESPREIEEQHELIKSRDMVIEMLWNSSQTMDQDNWTQLAVMEIGKFAHSLDEAFHHGVSPGSEDMKWTYYGSLFFAATVVSTIGYGHHAPVTPAGRIVCILYALVGIPLYLFCVADLGLLLARGMTRLLSLVGYQLWRFERDRRNQKFKDNRRSSSSKESVACGNTSAKSNSTESTTCSPRDSPHLPANTSENDGASSSSRLGKTSSIDSEEIAPSGKQSSTNRDRPEIKIEPDNVNKGEALASSHIPTCQTGENKQKGAVLVDKDMDVISLDDDVEDSVPELLTDIANSHCTKEDGKNNSKLSTIVRLNMGTQGNGLHPSLTHRGRDPRLTIFSGTPTGTEDLERAEQERVLRQHQFIVRKPDVPLSVVVLLFFLYNVLCALVIKQWEGWDFLTAFYFSFITLSTIGFGDVFPEHQKNLLGFSVMILVGMAVLTMCISLAQNQTYRQVQKSLAKVKALTKRTTKTESDPEQPT